MKEKFRGHSLGWIRNLRAPPGLVQRPRFPLHRRPRALEEPRKLDTKVFSDAQVPISALRDGPDGRVAFCLAGEEEIVPCKETDGAKRGFFESVFGAR